MQCLCCTIKTALSLFLILCDVYLFQRLLELNTIPRNCIFIDKVGFSLAKTKLWGSNIIGHCESYVDGV